MTKKALHDKFEQFSKHQLIKENNLKKNRNSDVYIVKYVSKLICNVTNRKNNIIIYTTNHDKEIEENF